MPATRPPTAFPSRGQAAFSHLRHTTGIESETYRALALRRYASILFSGTSNPATLKCALARPGVML